MHHAPLRILLVLGAAAAVLGTLGCFNANLDIKLRPDLAMDVGVEMRIPSEFMTEDSGPGEMADFDQMTVEIVDGTHVIRGVRRLAPGEMLAADDADQGMEMMRQKVARRLSTRYIFVAEFTGSASPMAADSPFSMDEADAEGADPEGAGDDEGAFDPRMFEGFVSSFFSGFEFGMTVQMPGRLLSTTGEDLGGGATRFSLGLDQVMSNEPARFMAVSSLPNYSHLGRLADQMMLAGGDAAVVGQLPAFLDAGLLPDPPLEISAQYKLGPEDYLLLATIIATLDAQLPTGMTEAIVKRLGLNADDTRPEQIHAAAKAVAGKDLPALAVEGVLKSIK